MKKFFFIAVLTMAALSASAQLEVDSLGRIIMADEVGNVKTKVLIGTNSDVNVFYDKATLFSKVTPTTAENNIAILGDARRSTYFSIENGTGVMGIAGNTHARNIGVWGCLYNGHGAAVYGSCSLGISTPYIGYGSYAGLFEGPTLVNGTLTTTNVVQSSDARLKTNITSLDDAEQGAALTNIMKMNAVSYNFKERENYDDIESSELVEIMKKEAERLHFGLIAQELAEIYPNLVYERQDGMLGINYSEIIPVLIQAVHELKEKVDMLEGNDASYAKPNNTANIESLYSEQNKLYQNTPNPFKENTTIRFQLADDVKDAAICIFDMQGKMLKQYNVGTNDNQLTINAFELGEGMFLYSLIADGKEIDTKRMILTK